MPIKHPKFPILRKCCYRVSISVKANFKILAGLMLLITATMALAQFKSGTIIVLGYSKHKVVIAADSRVGNEDGTHGDNGCKIIALNDKFLFATSGRPRDITGGLVGWDATDQAKTALDAVLKRGKDPTNYLVVGDVANLWVELIGPRIDHHIRPQEFSALKPNQIYVDGVFVAPDPSELHFAYAVIRRGDDRNRFISPRIQEAHMPDKMVFTAMGGESAIFYEFMNKTSERAKKEGRITAKLAKKWKLEEADVRMAIRLVDLVIKYSKSRHVATPIDAAELSVGHTVNLIQRKPNCQDNQ